MSRKPWLLIASFAGLGVGACSSLVSDPCETGFRAVNGSCVPVGIDSGLGSDGGTDGRHDAGPDARPDARPDGGSSDGGMMHDGGSGSSDGGMMHDGGSGGSSDGGVMNDAGSGGSSDGGVMNDAGSGGSSDGGVMNDAGSGSSSDGGVPNDAGSGSSSDGGVTHDAGSGSAVDAGVLDAGTPIDGAVCALPMHECGGQCIDVTSDPDNCGFCGNVCPTGICFAGFCVGSVPGHIVAIGHDYRTHNVAMARVLGNSIGLGDSIVVRVGYYRGTATAQADAGTQASATSALTTMGRAHVDVTLGSTVTPDDLAALDVLVVEAQTGQAAAAAATGAMWHDELEPFVSGGGVVVVLEGAGGVSYALADAAGLYTVPPPTTATGSQVTAAAPTDAVADQVPTPYLAQTTSVTFTGEPPVFATTPGGATVVFHLTR